MKIEGKNKHTTSTVHSETSYKYSVPRKIQVPNLSIYIWGFFKNKKIYPKNN